MLIAKTVVGLRDRLDSKFAILVWQCQQLASGEALRGPALISIDVRCGGAQYCVMRLGECFQTKTICRSAVEHYKYFGIGPEVLLKFAERRFRVDIISVPDSVSAVGGGNGL